MTDNRRHHFPQNNKFADIKHLIDIFLAVSLKLPHLQLHDHMSSAISHQQDSTDVQITDRK